MVGRDSIQLHRDPCPPINSDTSPVFPNIVPSVTTTGKATHSPMDGGTNGDSKSDGNLKRLRLPLEPEPVGSKASFRQLRCSLASFRCHLPPKLYDVFPRLVEPREADIPCQSQRSTKFLSQVQIPHARFAGCPFLTGRLF